MVGADGDTNRARQPVLDAVVALQGHRLAASTALAAAGGEPVGGARVVASGPTATPATMMRHARGWRHLLSTRPLTDARQLRESLPGNDRCLRDGLEMISVFDREGTTPAARRLLAGEPGDVYFLSYAPVQMRLANHRVVYLQGPELGGAPSLMTVTTPPAIEAAYRYFRAVLDLATPCREDSAPAVPFTARQVRIMELLALGLADDRIAETLAVSTRTVRYDIAAVMDGLGVGSRFAAGMRYAELLHGPGLA
ncbi:MAG: hypothetical protein AVDCRST_MAG41-1074 [uncultured Corynebacteriales bacterium]|uniref:HTH luxR-type domain-containing protein n=1 Tax=uncultured Mycobacteriales bacterium TaxID=581187 RepID=A0A6J4HV77_9ACTN|nr:MAG: hypothetical protein AVDCRST_MAG41-1074 [uncultured Corynebacteriales bacterium]